MNRQKILTILRNQEDLFDRFSIKNLYLFGSAAKDMATATSDVDLLVEFTEDAPVSLFQFARLRRELSQILDCKVDLVTPEALHPKLKADILKEAVHAA